MLCFVIIGIISTSIHLRFSNEIHPISRYKVLYQHDGYNIIYDHSERQGYMQVAKELEENIERVYNDLRDKDPMQFVISTGNVDSDSELEEEGTVPIDEENVKTLVAQALQYMDVSNERFVNMKIVREMCMLEMLKDRQCDESDRSSLRAFVYNARERVFVVSVGIRHMASILDGMQSHGHTDKYDVGSEAFASGIEGFYRHIYGRNGVLAPSKDGHQPYNVAECLCPRMHAILSIMGATSKVIRVKNAGDVQYYFRLASYRDIFRPTSTSLACEEIDNASQ